MIKSAPIMLWIGAVILGAAGVVEGLIGYDIPGITVESNWLGTLLGSLGLGGVAAVLQKK